MQNESNRKIAFNTKLETALYLILYFIFFVEAFEYLTLDLNKVPGQGLGLSIVGRR